MYVRADKPVFMERLEKVKPILPYFYCTEVQKKFPNVKRHNIYSVLTGGNLNWDILEELERIAEHYQQLNENVTLQTV